MWEIILLLLVVSVISLMLKPREPFREESMSELDILKGFNLDFNKTYDAVNDEVVQAKLGSFNVISLHKQNGLIKGEGSMYVTASDKLFLLPKNGVVVSRAWNSNGNLEAQGTIKAGALEVTGTLTVGNQVITAADILKLKQLK